MGKKFFKKSPDSRRISADYLVVSGPTTDNRIQLTAVCNVIDLKSVDPQLGYKGDDWSREMEIVGELIFPKEKVEPLIVSLLTRFNEEERKEIVEGLLEQIKSLEETL